MTNLLARNGNIETKNALRDIAITTAGGNAANWGSHKSKIHKSANQAQIKVDLICLTPSR